ncbi:hypothetical protein SCHPADRAFT_997070 [Schizopora paradoxa]|uniref:MYND-type domain-containing protein n=1 Tax=Schizopora paradoxa TaxID=27342 RepID=A0A0H2SA47_9AGAM|nr:hypothetical protein SCHPADRAFT_997070 [Schizopora paradoxa]
MGSQKLKRPSNLPQAERETVGEYDGVLSKQVLAAARRGSFYELMQVSEALLSSKELFTAQLLDVLLCQFQSAVPTNMSSSTFLTDPGVQQRIGVFGALHLLFARKDAIVAKDIQALLKTTWPDTFSWMQYFYTANITNQYGTSGSDEFMLNMLIGVFLLFLVAQNDCDSKFVTKTPGAARLATQLCLKKALIIKEVQKGPIDMNTIIKPYEAIRVLFMTIQELEEQGDRILDEVVEAVRITGEGLTMPEILQNRIQIALRAGLEETKIFADLIQLTSRFTLNRLAHPIRQDIVEMDMVPFAVKSLAELAARVSINDCSNPDLLVSNSVVLGFEFICYMFNTRPGTQWVLQALNAGFLEMFVAWSPMFPFFPAADRERILLFLSTQFMPYLVSFPVLLASEDILKQMDAQKVRETVERSSEDTKLAWDMLEKTVSRRAAIGKVSWGVRAHRTKFVCDTCCKIDITSTFKKCAGCEKALYCSKSCQVKGWKERGHRKECKELKKQGLQENSLQISTRKLNDAILRDVAKCDAYENIEKLRIMAKEQVPGVHIDDVGIEIGYDAFPPTFHVFARPECIRARQASEQGVDVPSSSESSLEPRRFVGDKMRRLDKELTLLIVKVKDGEGNVCHPYGIAKFWDGMDDDDIAFEARVQAELHPSSPEGEEVC